MAEIADTRRGGGSSRWAVRAGLFLALALVAAGGAALLLTRWVNARMAVARVPTAPVVVAAEDLPVGTRLARKHLRAVDWPEASRPRSATSDPAAWEGRVVASRLYQGEPLLAEKLVSGKAGQGLAALLPEGARAVSVRVDDVAGVAGFVHPGDVVDVIVTMRPSESTGSYTSKIILQAIRVLAVGKEVDAAAQGNDKVFPSTVATLQVDSLQAERLALAASRGQLLLALRNGADGALVETRGVGPAALLAPVEPALQAGPAPRVAGPPPVPPPATGRDRQVVEILRGDLFERRQFEKKEDRR
jgi:pilus assembly protein CpaB